MLTCKEASRLMSSRQEQTLGVAERAALALHLVACRACRKVEAQMAFLRRALTSYSGRGPDRDDGTS